ncbi:capsular polysaccharide transport system permease protein [Litoreibacter albidus]|uniref:Capsular polysaccharide transport system permease protein n=2 Tax=Litoreibacter albidus TaxID=670155 RepID=A0A1H3D7Y8_9RHOB|nr:capsular polysaccharide transport system permease protein [Litoreibacter albidus]
MAMVERKTARFVDLVPAAPAATPLRTVSHPAKAGKTARAARVRPRHMGAALSFLLLVLLPVFAIAVYLYYYAADQYLSEASFSIHREETTTGVSSLLGGLTGVSSGTSDADVLYQFIQSHDLVLQVNSDLDLRSVFSKHYDTDMVFGLSPDASLEELVDFWNRMVTVQLERTSGIITVAARGFTANDSHALTSAVLKHSNALVERLSRTAHDDSMRHAKAEMETASLRLKEARVNVSTFRKTSQTVDPGADVESQMGVLGVLEQKLADALIALAMLADVTKPTDPRLKQAKRKVQTIRTHIDEERASIGSRTTDSMARGNLYTALETYEALLVDQEFAEQSYIAALANYDAATSEARRKSRYLVAHITPSLPQTAKYPQKIVIGVVTAVMAMLAWMLMVLVGYSIRDRR